MIFTGEGVKGSGMMLTAVALALMDKQAGRKVLCRADLREERMKWIYLTSEDGRALTGNEKMAQILETNGWRRCTQQEYRQQARRQQRKERQEVEQD